MFRKNLQVTNCHLAGLRATERNMDWGSIAVKLGQHPIGRLNTHIFEVGISPEEIHSEDAFKSTFIQYSTGVHDIGNTL